MANVVLTEMYVGLVFLGLCLLMYNTFKLLRLIRKLILCVYPVTRIKDNDAYDKGGITRSGGKA